MASRPRMASMFGTSMQETALRAGDILDRIAPRVHSDVLAEWNRKIVLTPLFDQPGLPGELGDAPVLVADLGEELLGRRVVGNDAERLELRFDRGIADGALERRNQRARHLRRNARGREERGPDAEERLLVAQL